MKFALVISVLLLGVVPYNFPTFVGANLGAIIEPFGMWLQEFHKSIETLITATLEIGAQAIQEIVDYSGNATSMINNIASSISNSPECRSLIEALNIITLSISEISKKCVSAKMENIVNSRKEIAIVSEQITAGLQDLASKNGDCRTNIFRMPYCLVKLGAEATAYQTQKSIQINARRAKFVALVASLTVSIPYCIFETGLKVLPEKIKKVSSGVQACTTSFATNVRKLLKDLYAKLYTASEKLGIESGAESQPKLGGTAPPNSVTETSENNSSRNDLGAQGPKDNGGKTQPPSTTEISENNPPTTDLGAGGRNDIGGTTQPLPVQRNPNGEPLTLDP